MDRRHKLAELARILYQILAGWLAMALPKGKLRLKAKGKAKAKSKDWRTGCLLHFWYPDRNVPRCSTNAEGHLVLTGCRKEFMKTSAFLRSPSRSWLYIRWPLEVTSLSNLRSSRKKPLKGLSRSAMTKQRMEMEKTVIMQMTRERNVDWVSIRATPKKEKNPRISRNTHLKKMQRHGKILDWPNRKWAVNYCRNQVLCLNKINIIIINSRPTCSSVYISKAMLLVFALKYNACGWACISTSSAFVVSVCISMHVLTSHVIVMHVMLMHTISL